LIIFSILQKNKCMSTHQFKSWYNIDYENIYKVHLTVESTNVFLEALCRTKYLIAMSENI
jgi:hypothetical protein